MGIPCAGRNAVGYGIVGRPRNRAEDFLLRVREILEILPRNFNAADLFHDPPRTRIDGIQHLIRCIAGSIVIFGNAAIRIKRVVSLVPERRDDAAHAAIRIIMSALPAPIVITFADALAVIIRGVGLVGTVKIFRDTFNGGSRSRDLADDLLAPWEESADDMLNHGRLAVLDSSLLLNRLFRIVRRNGMVIFSLQQHIGTGSGPVGGDATAIGKIIGGKITLNSIISGVLVYVVSRQFRGNIELCRINQIAKLGVRCRIIAVKQSFIKCRCTARYMNAEHMNAFMNPVPGGSLNFK